MGTWALNLFGGFELVSPQGAPVRIAERKARALLAYLALARERSVSREALMALFWEDRPPAQAGQSLRQVLYRLRAATGEPTLLRADKEEMAIDPARVDVDVWRFLDTAHRDGTQELQRAAALYRGPALAGIRRIGRAGYAARGGSGRHDRPAIRPGVGRTCAGNPAGRYGEPMQLGAACAFLCSAQAGYVTGQSLLVDGGAYPGTL